MQALHSLSSTNMADNITRKYNSPWKKTMLKIIILQKRKESGIWLIRSLTRKRPPGTSSKSVLTAIDSTEDLVFLALRSFDLNFLCKSAELQLSFDLSTSNIWELRPARPTKNCFSAARIQNNKNKRGGRWTRSCSVQTVRGNTSWFF